MTMTRKDFVAVADKIARLKQVQTPADWQRGVAFVMAAMNEINPNFNDAIFRKACGTTEDDDRQIRAIYLMLGGS